MSKNEQSDYNPVLQKQILEVVENQIKDNNPKETKQTLNRLLSLGYTREDAIKKIGGVVAEEIFDILKKQEQYNEKRYLDKLFSLK